MRSLMVRSGYPTAALLTSLSPCYYAGNWTVPLLQEELTKRGSAAESTLRQALQRQLSAEAQRQVKRLLE
jgi:hypothetical protein